MSYPYYSVEEAVHEKPKDESTLNNRLESFNYGEPVRTRTSTWTDNSKTAFFSNTCRDRELRSGQRFHHSISRAWSWMIGLFIGAAIVAVLHDVYNSILDGKAVSSPRLGSVKASNLSQDWANRISTVIALVFKTLLSAGVSIAFTAVLWEKLKRRPLSINALDALFTIQNDPFAFRHIEIWLRAFSIVFLAGLTWALPFASAFTPDTLSVSVEPISTTRICNIPLYDPSSPSMVLDQHLGANAYTGPNAVINSTSLRTLGTGSFLSIPNPCGSGGCAYNVAVKAPMFKCEDVEGGYFNSTDPLPDRQLSGLYWEGYEVIGTDKSITLVLAHRNGNTTCSPFYGMYDLKLSHQNDTLSITNITRNFVDPMTYIALNESNVFFTSTQDIRNAFAIKDAVVGLLAGTIKVLPASTGVDTFFTSAVGASNFASYATVDSDPDGHGTFKTILNISRSVSSSAESLLTNVSISLLSLPSVQRQDVHCDATANVQVWKYDRRTLWLAYGAALLTALGCTIWGSYEVYRNGGGMAIDFSMFLLTTRNESLNGVARFEKEELEGTKLMYGPGMKDSLALDEGTWAFGTEKDFGGSFDQSPLLPSRLNCH
ncbi:hypothetical protein BT69DRAFT_1355848 [Atractiella rhizophila]|nr:hypothetical protein BT69DRAFT_1355848 [Atractiella rhizophila]